MGDIYLKGIKYSGGSNVVPNPEGEATDTLSTIGIGNTIFDIAGSGGGSTTPISELIEFGPGDGTNSRTFTINGDRTPKNLILTYFEGSGDTGWATQYELIWGASRAFGVGSGSSPATSGEIKAASITYDTDGKTFTLTASNAGSALNSTTGHGYILVNYGEGSVGSGATSEIIPITAGDGTTSRTFTFDKIPKFIKFYWQDATLDGGWATDGDMLWGQSYMNYRSKRMGATVANVDGGISTITYGADNKSITITGGNAFGAMNSINGSGYMFIDYGSSGGSGGSEDISDMTWTLLTSTSGTGSATAIPSDTKYLVVAVKDTNNGKVIIAAKESISAINKVLDVLGETAYILHGYWKDQSGNDYGDASAQISNGYVTAYSSYNTLTTYVYALS